MDRSKCREYTKDEIIEKFLNDLDDKIEYGSQKDSSGRLDGNFVAGQVIKALDGTYMDYSYLELIAIDERADIHGELYSLFTSSNERLSSLLNKGIITDMTAGFVKRVKELTKEYDNDTEGDYTELVAGIFDIIDKGIDGKRFRLDIGSSTEDRQELVANGENYYPIKTLTISGDLGERYRGKIMDKVHEYTKEEMVDLILKDIHTSLEYWSKSAEERNSNGVISGSFVSHLILSTLDGGRSGLPYMDLVVPPSEDRINLESHSIKTYSVEKIRELVEDGTLPKAKADFIIAVKDLETRYDNGEIGTYDDFAFKIFEMIDNGFGEHKCVLRAGAKKDEIEEDEIEDDYTERFPTGYPVISGKMAARYKEMFMDKVKEQKPKKTAKTINMQNALNESLRGEDRVTPKDFGGIKAFFKNLGKAIGGVTKDDK